MAKKNGTAETPVRRPLKPMAVKIEADLVDEARAAAAQLGGLPHQMTLGRMVSEALRSHLERLRREHNRGRPFWPIPARLRQGRPLKIHRPDNE